MGHRLGRDRDDLSMSHESRRHAAVTACFATIFLTGHPVCASSAWRLGRAMPLRAAPVGPEPRGVLYSRWSLVNAFLLYFGLLSKDHPYGAQHLVVRDAARGGRDRRGCSARAAADGARRTRVGCTRAGLGQPAAPAATRVIAR